MKVVAPSFNLKALSSVNRGEATGQLSMNSDQFNREIMAMKKSARLSIRPKLDQFEPNRNAFDSASINVPSETDFNHRASNCSSQLHMIASTSFRVDDFRD